LSRLLAMTLLRSGCLLQEKAPAKSRYMDTIHILLGLTAQIRTVGLPGLCQLITTHCILRRVLTLLILFRRCKAALLILGAVLRSRNARYSSMNNLNESSIRMIIVWPLRSSISTWCVSWRFLANMKLIFHRYMVGPTGVTLVTLEVIHRMTTAPPSPNRDWWLVRNTASLSSKLTS